MVPTPFLVPMVKKIPKMWKGRQTRECLGAPNQIDLHKDEEVEEIEADEKGWTKIKNKQGDTGLVPTELLSSSRDVGRKRMKCVGLWECYGAEGQISIQLGEKVDAMSGDINGLTKVRNMKGEEGNVPTKLLVIINVWKARATYSSEGLQGILDLDVGETVEELEPDNEGWTKLEKSNGKVGIAPTNYLGKALSMELPLVVP